MEAQSGQLVGGMGGGVDVEPEAGIFQSLGKDPAQAIEVNHEGGVVQVVSSDKVVMVATDVTVSPQKILPERDIAGECAAVDAAYRRQLL